MEPVRGQPLILDRLNILFEARHERTDVLIVLPPDNPKRVSAVMESRATVVINPSAKTGMASSINAALARVPKWSTSVLFLPADMPDITANDIDRLRQAHKRNPRAIIRAATSDNRPGNPVIFPRPYFSQLMKLEGDQSGRDVIRANAENVDLVPLKTDRATTDLDTPEAWAAWRAANPLL